MGDFLNLPTAIIIIVAIVIIVRLRSVLGTRTGNERQPMAARRTETAPTKDASEKAAEKVVPLRPAAAPIPDRDAIKLEAEIERFSLGNAETAAGLNDIAAADPAFSPKYFLEGAKTAYEMIVTAFAAGDRKTLRNLLERDVYDDYDRAITERETAGDKVEFTFVGLPKVDMSAADSDGKNAQITIQFNAEVVSATRNAANEIIEGSTEQVVTIADEWTFARNLRARDPNWKLAASKEIS